MIRRLALVKSIKIISGRQKLKTILPGLWHPIYKYYKIIVPTIICVTFLTLLFIYVTNSKPGDLLFPVKVYSERLDNAKNNAEQMDNDFNVLSNRVSSYKKLSEKNECVRAGLARDEVLDKLIVMDNHAQNYNGDEYKKVLTLFYEATVPLSDITTQCNQTSLLWAFPNMFALVAYLNFQDVELNLEEMVNSSSRKLDTLRVTLAQNPPRTQEQLDQVNSLLIKANKNIENAHELFKNGENHNLFLTITTNNFIYKTSEALLNNQFFVYNYEDYVYAICTLRANESSCERTQLQSRWNSVYDKKQAIEQIELGEKMLKEYLELMGW